MTRDDVQTMLSTALQGVSQQLAGVVGEMRASVEQALARPQAPVVVQQQAQHQQVPNGLSDDEIDQAIMTGTGAAARIRALVDRAAQVTADRIIRDHVAPLQEFGVNTISELSRRVLPNGRPLFLRYQKEIDAKLDQLVPELRANPKAVEMVYTTVLGEHHDELMREAAEQAVRTAQEAAAAPTGRRSGSTSPGTGAGAGGVRETPGLPSVEELGGSLGLEALALKGRGGQDGDELAQTLGYESWDAYMKSYQALLKSEGQV
jgi:hypothetical protein